MRNICSRADLGHPSEAIVRELMLQFSSTPEVVEVWDTHAADPTLLVALKGYRNSVPVPRHWCHKRKYLQGKRGVEKAPWQLPEFIAATGIEKIRASVMEKENAKKLKGKMKEKMQPKMGKIDIDYQVLHDAFFKFQTKPRMTRHGDVYYEGKEFEVSLREKRPGVLSDDMKKATKSCSSRQLSVRRTPSLPTRCGTFSRLESTQSSSASAALCRRLRGGHPSSLT